MSIRPIYEPPRDDKYSATRLLLRLRPHTLAADLMTGVVERRESLRYCPSTIRRWVRDSPKILFKVNTDYWGAREPSSSPRDWRTDVPSGARKFRIEGSADEIVADIERIRGWPDDPIVGAQYL
jgi:hypothetical protein